MRDVANPMVDASSFDRNRCDIGIVHIGFGAFHRAHQAVYVDDYMQQSGDLRWGIAAVNLRAAEADHFRDAQQDVDRNDGYYLKSFAPDATAHFQRIRSHVAFFDWSQDANTAETVVARDTVHLVTITVTESGYYTDPVGNLDLANPLIRAELDGQAPTTVYGYLRRALHQRMNKTGAPLTIACCDNIRKNGKMLSRNLKTYLSECGDHRLLDWVGSHVAFPCSMVDRITPRSPASLAAELTEMVGQDVTSPIMAEDFLQWVLEDNAAGPMPDLGEVGVTVTDDVDPYEETKIRVLNGGHTALTYMAALDGFETFDAAMRSDALAQHFNAFETQEVLPAISMDLPFAKTAYLDQITRRFRNQAIGDTVARICADGMAKFPIFIRPTIRGCLQQGIIPIHAIQSIASWHQFARHVQAGKIGFEYVEPAWDLLVAMLGTDEFVTSHQLWGDIPNTHPEFAATLRDSLKQAEMKWPV